MNSHELWVRTLAKVVRVPTRVRAWRRARIAVTMSRHFALRTYGVRIRKPPAEKVDRTERVSEDRQFFVDGNLLEDMENAAKLRAH